MTWENPRKTKNWSREGDNHRIKGWKRLLDTTHNLNVSFYLNVTSVENYCTKQFNSHLLSSYLPTWQTTSCLPASVCGCVRVCSCLSRCPLCTGVLVLVYNCFHVCMTFSQSLSGTDFIKADSDANALDWMCQWCCFWCSTFKFGQSPV